MLKRLGIIILGILFQTCYGGNVISLPYIANDIAYSKVHGRLYALIDAMDPDYGNRIIEINVTTGVVERSQFVGSQPVFLRLTSDENFAWISFAGTPFVKRVDLNTFEVDKEIYLGPSKKRYSPNHRLSTVFCYNFTVLPDDDNKVALGLKTPFEFDWEAIALYKNDTIQPKRILDNATMFPPYCFEPVLNGDYLVGHYQSSSYSVYSTMKVLDTGLIYMKEATTELHGQLYRNWFKVHNDTLCAAVGTILDATDTSGVKVLGTCVNDIIGDRYGFAYSEIHNAYVYPHINNKSIYLTFYNKNTFEAFTSAYLLEYPFNQIMLILELEIIDKNKFAILIGKDYGDFTIRIVETNEIGIEAIRAKQPLEIFPNPASGKLYMEGLPVNKRICIYDITGRLIETYERTGITGEIDLGNFNPGTYLLEITDPDGHYNRSVRKIVVQ